MEAIWQDLRYGIRMFAKSPGFSAAAVLMLAVGIGANTVIFSLLDSTLRYDISKYKDYDRLYIVLLNNLKEGLFSVATYADYVDIRDHNQVFEDLGATSTASFILTGGEQPERVLGTRASTNLFSMLGKNPLLGRTFLPGDDDSVAILSHKFWRDRFGSDPSVVGKGVILDGRTLTVVGVLPADNEFPPGDVCVPYSSLSMSSTERLVDVYPKINIIGKVKRGLPFDQVRSSVNNITKRLEQQFQLAPGALYAFMWHPPEGMSSTIRELFFMLQGAVALVLLLACANVANLLVARAMARRREMATRLALGAGRFRLLRQLLTEGLLLSALGTICGLVLAVWASKSLAKILSELYPYSLMYLFQGVTWNGRVLAFTTLVSLLTGTLFSLVPALRASRTDLIHALKQNPSSATGFARFEGRSLMVMLQVALALTVLIASGLLLKGLSRAHGIFVGQGSEKILTMTLSPNRNAYLGIYQMRSFYDQMLETVATVPGVVSVEATGGNWPYTTGDPQIVDFALEGAPRAFLLLPIIFVPCRFHSGRAATSQRRT
jgi:putative ABC transport system permease protein